MEKLNLKPLEAMVADKIHKSIVEQNAFIANQDNSIAECLIGDRPNGYNLRQNVQAGETAKKALDSLKVLFKSYVGVDYDDYVKTVTVEKPQSIAERLMSVVREALKS